MSDIKIATITTIIFALVSTYFGIFFYYFGPMGIFIAFVPFLLVVAAGMLWVMIYNMVDKYYKGQDDE